MSAYGMGELAIETHLVIHVEQITGGAAIECHCGRDAVLFITSEPEMEPGPVCGEHAREWIGVTMRFLRSFYPPPEPDAL